MNLYDINTELLKAIDTEIVNEETGEVTIDQNAIDQLTLQFEEKVDNIASYIKSLDAEAEAIKNEETNLKTRRERIEKKTEWLKQYLSSNLQLNNRAKFESPRNVLTFRKSVAVEIHCTPDTLPVDYQVVKMSVSADKMKIKNDLKNGFDVPNCELVESMNLQIK